MKRSLTCIGFGFLLLCTQVGCVEPMASADPKESSNSKETQSQPEPTPAEIPQDSELLQLSTTDPLIANAIETRQQLIAQEEELLARLDDIRQLLGSAKVDPARLQQSIDEFLAVARDIRTVSQRAAESMSSMNDTIRNLARTTKHLGAWYRAAADLFRRKARDYTESRLRNQLLAFAEDYDAIAVSIPKRQKAIREFEAQVPRLKAKAQETTLFLDDAILFLSSHPQIGRDPRSRYSEEFESFAVTFSEWLRVLDDLRNQLREQAVSQVIQSSYRKEVQVRFEQEEAKLLEAQRIAQEKERVEAQAQAKVKEEARQKEEAKAREQQSKLAVKPVPTVQAVTSNHVHYSHTVISQPVYYSPCSSVRVVSCCSAPVVVYRTYSTPCSVIYR